MTRCFVIGPIGDQLAPVGSPGRDRYEQSLEVYEDVINAACRQVGIDAIRADQISTTGEITEQVFRHLYEDEVVIADLSDGNPNVMYELGLRHTRDLLTIQIGEYGQLPFDVSAIRTIMFSRSPRGLIEARKNLTTALTVGLSEGSDPVTATKVWARATEPGMARDFDPELIGIETEVEEVEEDGFIELVVRVEAGVPRLTETMAKISKHMEAMGAEADASTREFALLSDQGAPTSARLSAIARFATRLEGHASSLDESIGEFSSDMDEIDGSVNGILDFLVDHPEVVTEDVEQFLEDLTVLAVSARSGMEGIGQFLASVRGLAAYSKSLRRPVKRLLGSIERLRIKMRLVDEWEGAVVRLRRRWSELSDAASS